MMGYVLRDFNILSISQCLNAIVPYAPLHPISHIPIIGILLTIAAHPVRAYHPTMPFNVNNR